MCTSEDFKFQLPQGTKFKFVPEVDSDVLEVNIAEFSRILTEQGLFNLTQGNLYIRAVFNQTESPSPSNSGSSKRKTPDDDGPAEERDNASKEVEAANEAVIKEHIEGDKDKENGTWLCLIFSLPALNNSSLAISQEEVQAPGSSRQGHLLQRGGHHGYHHLRNHELRECVFQANDLPCLERSDYLAKSELVGRQRGYETILRRKRIPWLRLL